MKQLRFLFALALLALAGAVAATVPSTSSSAGPYTCNNSTTVFAVPFRFLAATDLVVTKKNLATGVETAFTLTTDYTVSGVGAAAGGSVTLAAYSRCPSGYTLSIRRSTARTQPKSLRASNVYNSSAVEDALDRVTIVAQEVGRDQDDASYDASTAKAVATAAAATATAASATATSAAALAQASAAAVAQGAVGGSDTLVTPIGTTTPRAAKDIAADVFGSLTAVVYASPTGSDSNTCKSWAYACKTWLAAFDKLPSAGGILYMADQTEVGGTSGQGVWIVGPQSASYYANPPAGWRKYKNVVTVGVGGIVSQFGRPAMARLVPTGGSWTGVPFWIAGTSNGFGWENVIFTAGGQPSTIRLGSHDPGGVRGPAQDLGITALVWFKNCLVQAPVTGPTVDGGWTFWIWFDQTEIDAQTGAAVDTDQRAAIYCEPPAVNGAYCGLFHVQNSRINGGNLVHVGNPGGGFIVENVTVENTSGSYLLRQKRTAAANSTIGGQHRVTGFYSADSVSTKGVLGVDVGVVTAGVVVDSQDPAGLGSSDVTTDYRAQRLALLIANTPNFDPTHPPTRNGGVGVSAGRLWGPHDGIARLSSVHALPYANVVADAFVAGAPSTARAPDGSFKAGRFTTPGTFLNAYHGFNVTPAVGDYFIFAAWVRDNVCPVPGGGGHRWALSVTNLTTSWGSQGYFYPPMSQACGLWRVVRVMAKITGGSGTKTLDVKFETLGGSPSVDVYQPTAIWVPGSEVSDDDVAEIFANLTPSPNGANPGDAALAKGSHLAAWDDNTSVWRSELYRGTAAPGSGTWNRGDFVWNSSPSAGGAIGWVATTGGSPGTWQNMVAASSSGTITLSTGSGTATVRSGAVCVCTDTTANASVKCAVASTTLTATGTGSDVVAYACF